MKKLVYSVAVLILITISLFSNKNLKSDYSKFSLDNLYTTAQAGGEIDLGAACVRLCWNAPSYSCILYAPDPGFYWECIDRYPY